jgi:hypothetical protein
VDIVYKILVVLHLVGMAMLVGGWLVTMRAPRMLPGMWHGALTQLVTGVALVGLASSGAVDRSVNNSKITVKLVVALVVAVLVFLGRRKPAEQNSPGAVHAVGGLALVNVLVAVLWS